jgi:hypothetical protein
MFAFTRFYLLVFADGKEIIRRLKHSVTKSLGDFIKRGFAA